MNRYGLSDLDPEPPALPRLLHGLAGRSPLRFASRAMQVGTELAWTGLLDRLSPLKAAVLREEAGRATRQGARLCLYLHWSPDGRISEMVRRQVALWRGEGFDVVFVTNAAPPPADWAAIGAEAVLLVQRRNVGRDFGAWRDAAHLALGRFGMPEELLLANDSVLGPFLPLRPLVEAWRAGGEGLFGMTESWGGGPHLQSFGLLARGRAVPEVLAHLAAFRDLRSKWRVVQLGEIGLSRRILGAGLRCAALFGYEAACAALDAPARLALGRRFAEAEALRRFPLNPTHHLWRALVEGLGFPYLKTELVLRNPGRLPGVERWREVVPQAAQGLIEGHLAIMGGRGAAARSRSGG